MNGQFAAVLLGVLGSTSAFALAVGAGTGQAPPMAHQRADGLCRRPLALAPLPPERERSGQDDPVVRRGAAYDGARAARSDVAGDVVVTGERKVERATAASPIAVPAPPAPPPPPPEPAPPPPPMAMAIPSPAPVVSAPPIVAAPSAPRSSAFSFRQGAQQPPAGLLTAGEHDDLLNPELYRRYVDAFLQNESLPGVPRVDTARVLTVAVDDPSGRPVPFAAVTLTCADGNTLHLATAADGEAAFFPDLDRLGTRVSVSVSASGSPAVPGRGVLLPSAPGAIRQTVTVAGTTPRVRRFDLALVVDCTGSMTDELRFLQSELRAIVERVRAAHPDLDIHVGLVAYRDVGDEYVTRTFPLTADVSSIQAALSRQSANGGGDMPEAVEQAMARATTLGWRADAVKSLLWVADAPPHADDVPAAWRAAEQLRAARVHIVPVAASGVDAGAEYIMRAMAAATQSRYLFLTDDSGIGDPHAPPAIDCYQVTRLDSAVARVLDAQIAGRRIDPAPEEVIRTVGHPDHGRCVLPPGGGQMR